MKVFTAIITSGLSVFFVTVNAQSKDIEKYRQQSDAMRKEVWAWDKPEFKVTTVPAQYANVSKVVLAHHTELTADSRSKFGFNGLGFGMKKEETISEVVREMVKVNDKNAVKYYSELSFTQFEKNGGFYAYDKTTSFVGVRVIKPNGKVDELNADDIVLTQDASSQKSAKVAIPNLQPGDIVDYFIATQQTLTNELDSKPYHVILFSDAPILSLSFHAQLARKYAIQYRSYNGAPDLQVNKNDDKDIIVDVIKTNIPAFETSLWVAEARELPFIRMNISLGYRGKTLYKDHLKPGEVSKNTESDEFLNIKARELSVNYHDYYWLKTGKAEFDNIESDAKKFAKQCNINFKDLGDEDKAAWLFYTLRYTKVLNFDIDQLSKKVNAGNYSYSSLAFPIYCTLKAAGVEPAILVTDYRTGYRMSEIMDKDDLALTTYLPGANKFLSMGSVYDVPFSTPGYIEGLTKTKSFSYNVKNSSMGGKKLTESTDIDEGKPVPVSSSDKNEHIENLKLSLSADKNSLLVHRSTTLKGLYKVDEQRQLILYQDFYEAERKAFNEDKSLIEELKEGKKSKKYVEEVENAFGEAKKRQKEAFKREAEGWFDQDVTDLKDYKTDTLGVRHTAPNFVYSSSFNLNGLVKKAGNNIIVEIGKIEGQPLIIKSEQRNRDVDVYMPYARGIEYNIEFEIPDGYSVDGVAALNKSVINDAGFFTAEAASTGKTVTIKVKKHYLHNFEPAKNWNKIIEFTDAAGDWVNAKLLLKKK